MMQDLIWLIRKTLRTTFSKKSSWLVYIGLPLAAVMLTTILYGNANGANLRVGIVNLDGNQPITQDTIAFVSGLKQVEIRETDEATLRQEIAAGKLDSGLVIEAGFADSVRTGKPERLNLVSVKGMQVTAYVKAMLDGYIGNVAAIGQATAGDAGRFDAVYRAYKQAGFQVDAESLQDTSHVKDMTYQSVGFLLMLMLFSATNLSEIILKEKENRTFLRLLSSPVSARTYVLSNVIVNGMILIVQVIVMLICLKYVFGVDSGVPFGELLATLLLFAVAAIGLSLLIVAFAKNSKGAGALQNLIVTPTCLLSGCFFPPEIMPETVRKIANFLPQHWALDMISKLQTGHAFGSLYLNMAIMLAFAALFAVVAVYRFGRNNDVRQFV